MYVPKFDSAVKTTTQEEHVTEGVENNSWHHVGVGEACDLNLSSNVPQSNRPVSPCRQQKVHFLAPVQINDRSFRAPEGSKRHRFEINTVIASLEGRRGIVLVLQIQ